MTLDKMKCIVNINFSCLIFKNVMTRKILNYICGSHSVSIEQQWSMEFFLLLGTGNLILPSPLQV